MNQNLAPLVGGVSSGVATPLVQYVSVGRAEANVAFTTSFSGRGESAGTFGGIGFNTCFGFTVPTGQMMLDGIKVKTRGNAD